MMSMSLAASAAVVTSFKDGVLSKVDAQLGALMAQLDPSALTSSLGGASGLSAGSLTSAIGSATRQYQGALHLTATGPVYVTIDATAKDGNGAALLSQLQGLGLVGGSSYGALASGILDVSALSGLASLTDLGFARESGSLSHAGVVTTQADHAQHDDIARAAFGLDGSGIKVGVLSDSFNTSGFPGYDGKPDTVAVDIARGDLPANTTILQDFADGTDEGRGMAQIIHDIAPGAAIAFATADYGQAGFANNILALAAAGSKIIVDDVQYFFEPAYQNGVIAQAVNQVAAAGVSYFSSAGNNGSEGWEGLWKGDANSHYLPDPSTGYAGETLMQFAPGQDYLKFTASGYDDIFILQWDEPAASAGGPGSRSDLDFFVTDKSGNAIYNLSAADNVNGDPAEGFDFQGVAGETYYLRVGLYSGPAPTEIKIMALGNGTPVDLATTATNLNDGTIYGHAAATGDIAVGASYYAQTPAYGLTPAALEYYSSTGPTVFWYSDSGVRYTTAQIHDGPAITAVDGGNTSFFYPGDDSDGDGFPNFFGTSAAAPGAAATAALLLQANASLTPQDIRHLLMDSVTDIDNPNTTGFDVGYDEASGAGLIQADQAALFAKTLTISNSQAPDLYGTHLADTITGDAADNLLQGFEGADYLVGGDGRDVLLGGDGADRLFGDAGDDVLVGGPGNDTMSGGADSDLYFLDNKTATGKDVVANFAIIDLLGVTAKLADSNNDGIITFGKNGVLNVNGSANTIVLTNVDPAHGLRSLGSADGIYYYAQTAGRPIAAKGEKVYEANLSTKTLTGSTLNSVHDVFFFDTALDLNLGQQAIKNFGSSDILVTTRALSDGNGDGIITFGSDHVLSLSGAGGVTVANGSTVVSALELDGAVSHLGDTYYIYSLIGSTAGVADLHFG